MNDLSNMSEGELTLAHYQAQQHLKVAKDKEKELRDEIVSRALKGQTGKFEVKLSDDGWHLLVEVPPKVKLSGSSLDFRYTELSKDARAKFTTKFDLTYSRYNSMDDEDKLILTESEGFAIVHGSPKVEYKKKDM